MIKSPLSYNSIVALTVPPSKEKSESDMTRMMEEVAKMFVFLDLLEAFNFHFSVPRSQSTGSVSTIQLK